MKLTLHDLPVKGKKVLMRVDFNVPLKDGHITDDSRIRAALPSIQYVLDQGGSIILMSHLGRPKAKPDKTFSLAPCAKRLSELLHKNVIMAPDCMGQEVEKMAQNLKAGEVLLLENLRFYPGEEDPIEHPEFVKSLASLGNCYVNDAFGTAHRNHASTAAITQYFPNESAMGFLIEKEVEKLSPLIHNPKRPFFAIIGGAKIDTKIGVIKELLKKVDALFLGGGMVYTFLKADGFEIGDSICENISLVQDIPRTKIHLPLDFVITDGKQSKMIDAKTPIPKSWQGVDIGPKTVAVWSKELEKGSTIFWNGPLGVFEKPEFAKGTKAIAQKLSHIQAKTIIGGGDSVAAIEQMGLQKNFDHLSTGGGASLEFLEFGHLPGIEALSDK